MKSAVTRIPVRILNLFLPLCIFHVDFDLDDDDTCRATVRMFLQCNLVQQFHIPYDVSETTICAVGPVDRQPNNSPRNIHRLGAVPMDAECEEELSTGEVPQLAACAECGPNDVRHDENRENGEIYD